MRPHHVWRLDGINGLDAVLVYVPRRDVGRDLRYDVGDWRGRAFHADLCFDLSITGVTIPV